MNTRVPHLDVLILEEKLRALNTLVHYETDPARLKHYQLDLALVACELNDARHKTAENQSSFAAAGAAA
jgi:hypothetical protein